MTISYIILCLIAKCVRKKYLLQKFLLHKLQHLKLFTLFVSVWVSLGNASFSDFLFKFATILSIVFFFALNSASFVIKFEKWKFVFFLLKTLLPLIRFSLKNSLLNSSLLFIWLQWSVSCWHIKFDSDLEKFFRLFLNTANLARLGAVSLELRSKEEVNEGSKGLFWWP